MVYTVYYKAVEDGELLNMVGSGYGGNEEEAMEDFKISHPGAVEITKIEFYKQ